MFNNPTSQGLLAVSIVCGLTLSALCMREEAGAWISVWLGIVATTFVGVVLTAVYFISQRVPALSGLLARASTSLHASLIVWCLAGLLVMAIITLASEPSRITDIGLYAPVGLLYGALSGLAYWYFSRGI